MLHKTTALCPYFNIIYLNVWMSECFEHCLFACLSTLLKQTSPSVVFFNTIRHSDTVKPQINRWTPHTSVLQLDLKHTRQFRFRKQWGHDTSGVFLCHRWWIETTCVSPPTCCRNRLKSSLPRSPPHSRCGRATGVEENHKGAFVKSSVAVRLEPFPGPSGIRDQKSSEEQTFRERKQTLVKSVRGRVLTSAAGGRCLCPVTGRSSKNEGEGKWPTRVYRFWDSPWRSWA